MLSCANPLLFSAVGSLCAADADFLCDMWFVIGINLNVFFGECVVQSLNQLQVVSVQENHPLESPYRPLTVLCQIGWDSTHTVFCKHLRLAFTCDFIIRIVHQDDERVNCSC